MGDPSKTGEYWDCPKCHHANPFNTTTEFEQVGWNHSRREFVCERCGEEDVLDHICRIEYGGAPA